MNKILTSKSGEIAAISAGILWGCLSIFVIPLYKSGFTNAQIIFTRLIFTEIMLALYIGLKNPALFRVSPKDLWIFAAGGIIGFTGNCLFYFRTIVYCGSAIAVVLLYTFPVFVIIASRFLFKEKIGLNKVLTLILIFSGCIFLSGIIGSKVQLYSPSSLLLGLCSGISFACYTIFCKLGAKKYSSFTALFYFLIFSIVSLFPFCLTPLPQVSIAAYSKIAGLCFGISFAGTFVPYILYAYCMKKISAGKASLFTSIEPLTGTLIGIFVFSEPVDFVKGLGIFLIFIGILIPSEK